MGRLHPKAHFLDVHLANGHHHSGSSTITTTTTATTTAPIYSSYFAGAIRPDITPLRLAPKEESTRVQLQKQRLKEQHARQIVATIPSVPGYKTSAAFFASLRTNLRLHASPPPSPISTPNSMRGSAASLPPPSPLAVPIMENEIPEPTDPLAGVPELNSYLATDEDERTDALMLVADSVAQQRNAANRALIFHPLNLAIFTAVFAWIAKFMLDKRYDWIAVGLTFLGVTMACFLGCRFLTQPYENAAESINWDWAGDADILVTKFGDEVIGTCMIEWVSGESRKKGKKAWRGLIKAWTVRLRYRHKGVGSALLEDAVKEAKKKGAEILEFADDHANSTRILPKLYNGTMNRDERKSREMLADLCETSPVRGKGKKLK